jgi:acyl carrier protein
VVDSRTSEAEGTVLTQERILQIVEEETGVKATLDTPVRDLGDSLDLVDLVLTLTEASGGSNLEEKLNYKDLHTVRDFVQLFAFEVTQ